MPATRFCGTFGYMRIPPRYASASMALVAPMWLQDALQVLLEGTSGVALVATATDVDSLTMLEMESDPDFVLLDADRDSASAVSQVKQIKSTWRKAECVALVDNTGQMPLLKEVGVSLTLLKGASPQRLREVLEALSEHKLRSESSALVPRL